MASESSAIIQSGSPSEWRNILRSSATGSATGPAAKKGSGKSARKGAKGGAVWAAHKKDAPQERMVAFCAGRDIASIPPADQTLALYDLWTNAAHVLMLAKIGVMKPKQAAAICAELGSIEEQIATGEFQLDPTAEDIHMDIERRVSAKLGADTGGRMHTGRSRNDQAATDLRLWLRDRLIETSAEVEALISVLCEKAEEWAGFPMPGYTHQQPGMVSSLGFWAAAHAQALTRDAGRLAEAFARINKSPLGAAAGYGVSWPLDRDYTAALLGFDAPEYVAVDCVTHRWEAEAECLQALAFTATHLSIIAQDIIWYSSPPNEFVKLPSSYTTGSSIMPQKRNPDLCEVIRAKAAHVAAQLQALFGQAKGMIAGYNRDSQWSKYAAFDAFREMRFAPLLLAELIGVMKPNKKRMKEACAVGFLNAVEVANELVRLGGIDFRTSYVILGKAVEQARARSGESAQLARADINRGLKAEGIKFQFSAAAWKKLTDPVALLANRQSPGSAAPAEVKEAAQQITKVNSPLSKQAAKLNRATTRLRREITALSD